MTKEPGFCSQLGTLLQKNIIIRVRTKILLVTELLWPLIFFLFLLLIRHSTVVIKQPQCTYEPKALPSAGWFSLFQSYFCTLSNKCVNHSISDMDLGAPGKNLPLAFYNESVLRETLSFFDDVEDVVNKFSMLDSFQGNFNGVNIADFFTKEDDMMIDLILHDKGLEYDAIESLLNSTLTRKFFTDFIEEFDKLEQLREQMIRTDPRYIDTMRQSGVQLGDDPNIVLPWNLYNQTVICDHFEHEIIEDKCWLWLQQYNLPHDFTMQLFTLFRGYILVAPSSPIVKRVMSDMSDQLVLIDYFCQSFLHWYDNMEKYAECFRQDRFVLMKSENEVERAASCLTKTYQYFLGIVFDELDNNSTALPKFTKYKIRMASYLVDSTIAFGWGCSFIALYEEGMQGLQWSTLFLPLTADHRLSFGFVLIMLIFDGILYLIFTWYIENVFPGAYGIPKPWLFFFQQKYWSRQKSTLPVACDGINSETVTVIHESSCNPVGVAVRHLTKVYDNKKACKKALSNLSVNFYDSEITSVLGPNGAGKTTMMSIICGLFPSTSGSVIIYGKDILSNISEIRQSLGFCPQHNILFDNLTVEEHLWFYAKLKGMPTAELNEEIENFLLNTKLRYKRKEISKNLSGGMKRKLSISIAFIAGSKTVVLDEPTTGVDPYSRRSIWDMLLKFKKGRTIILSTHYFDEAEILGDRIAIISEGSLKCSGSAMFLKTYYGSGYYLTLIKNSLGKLHLEKAQPEELIKFVSNYIPNAKLVRCSAQEVKFMLPSVNLLELKSLVTALDSELKNIGCSSYGLSESSLEEIFRHEITESVKANNTHKKQKLTMPSFKYLRVLFSYSRNSVSQCSPDISESDISWNISKLSYENSSKCFCGKDNTYICSENAYSFQPPVLKSPFSSIVNMSTLNITEWLTMTEKTYRKKRYGGFSTGLPSVITVENSYTDLNETVQLLKERILKFFQSTNINMTILQNSGIHIPTFDTGVFINLMEDMIPQYNVKVWFNNQGWAAFPAYFSAFSNAYLRGNLPSDSDSDEYGIAVTNHPIKGYQKSSLTQEKKKELQFSESNKVSSSEDDDGNVTAEQRHALKGACADNALKVVNLSKVYHTCNSIARKSQVVVNDLNFEVLQGECFGLLGHNGAGKTTTFKMITGKCSISQGCVYFAKTHAPRSNWKSITDIGYCPQFDALDERLTGREILQFYADIRSMCRKCKDAAVLHYIWRLGLNSHADRLIRTYSGGLKRRLSTAISLIGNPRIILLDEPTASMDPESRRLIWDVILERINLGQSVLLTSNSMEECEILCNRVGIMSNGSFKYGKGYVIAISLKAGNEWQMDSMIQELKDRLKLGSDHTKVSDIISCISALKEIFCIDGCALNQTSLDDVFVSLVEHCAQCFICMEFVRQLKTLLWKNFLIRSRLKCLFVAELLCPVIFFFFLVLIRQYAIIMKQPQCVYEPKALSSAGIFSMFQSYFCTLPNKCLNYTTDDWDLGPVSRKLPINDFISGFRKSMKKQIAFNKTIEILDYSKLLIDQFWSFSEYQNDFESVELMKLYNLTGASGALRLLAITLGIKDVNVSRHFFEDLLKSYSETFAVDKQEVVETFNKKSFELLCEESKAERYFLVNSNKTSTTPRDVHKALCLLSGFADTKSTPNLDMFLIDHILNNLTGYEIGFKKFLYLANVLESYVQIAKKFSFIPAGVDLVEQFLNYNAPTNLKNDSVMKRLDFLSHIFCGAELTGLDEILKSQKKLEQLREDMVRTDPRNIDARREQLFSRKNENGLPWNLKNSTVCSRYKHSDIGTRGYIFVSPRSPVVEKIVEKMKSRLDVVAAFKDILLSTFENLEIYRTKFESSKLSKASKYGNVLKYTDMGCLLVFFVAYAFAIIPQCFLMSTMFNQANVAAGLGTLLYFALFLPYPAMLPYAEYMTNAHLFFSCLIPQIAFGWGCSILASFEEAKIGLKWSTFTHSLSAMSYLNFFAMISMLLFDGALLFVLTWYIENVYPGTHGIPKPWHFFLMPSYWTGCKTDKENKSKVVYSALESKTQENCNLEVGVSVRNLTKIYGSGNKSKCSLNNLSVDFYANQITAVLGPNGAGKTTMMSIMCGLFPPTSGNVLVYNQDIMSNLAEVRRSVGFCPQHNVLFDTLTVEEHLQFYASLKRLTGTEQKLQIQDLLKQTKLMNKRNAYSKHLSDRTIILSTHFFDEAELLGDRIAIICAGKLKCCGSPVFLKQLYKSGCNLNLALSQADLKNNGNTTATLVDFVCGFVPDAKLVKCSPQEIQFTFPTVDLLELKSLITELDAKLANLKCSSYGLAEGGIEKIFLQEVALSKEDEQLPSQQQGFSAQKSLSGKEEKLASKLSSDKTPEKKQSPHAVNGLNLEKENFFEDRFYHSSLSDSKKSAVTSEQCKTYFESIWLQIILPVFLVALALYLLSLRFSEVLFNLDYRPITVDETVYGRNTYMFYSSVGNEHNSVNKYFQAIIEDIMKHGMGNRRKKQQR
ncbi:ABC transporter, ATP-binding protein, partial [Trichinella nativa]